MNRFFTLIAFVLLTSAGHAQSMSVIQLENRPAAEVIPIIEPMLGSNDAISGEGFKLFLRASPGTVANVREMVAYLDAPLKILEVSVFQGSEQDLRRLTGSARLQVDSGDVRIDVGDDGEDDAAGRVRYSTSDGSVSVGGSSTQGSLRDGPVHRVRVTEGTEAYIETGQRIPYFFSTGLIGRNGFASGVEYRESITGFYVLPRVRGENVVLDVSPFKSPTTITGRNDEISTQSASTTVTGRVGQWLLIGGITEQITRSDSTTGNTVRTQGGGNSGIWIRADLVR